LAQQRRQLDENAERQGDYLYKPYLQIRVHSVVDLLAAGICQIRDYKEEQSNIAFLIRLIVDAWARQQGLIGEKVDEEKRHTFLRQLDLDYTRRRFAFVLQGVNKLYGNEGAPPRQYINQAKIALYNRIDKLNALIGASSESLAETVATPLRNLFPSNLTDA